MIKLRKREDGGVDRRFFVLDLLFFYRLMNGLWGLNSRVLFKLSLRLETCQEAHGSEASFGESGLFKCVMISS